MSFRNDPLGITQLVCSRLTSAYHYIDFVGNHLNSEDPELKREAERILGNLQKEDIRSNHVLTDILVRVQKLTGESVDPRQYADRLKQAYDSGEDMEGILSDAKKSLEYIKIFLG